jgi:Tfx family DNA-binding protein
MQRFLVALTQKVTQQLSQKIGLFTKRQFAVLKLRVGGGLSQLETAKKLGTSRSNVSMIESRAREKLEKARETLKAFESIVSRHFVKVDKGMRLHDIPAKVLQEGDKYGIHLRSNIIDIIRMVKQADPRSARTGTTTRELEFVFTQSGVLSLLLDGKDEDEKKRKQKKKK